MSFLEHLHRVSDKTDLSPEQAEEAMLEILAGDVSPVRIAAMLVALRMKGETSGEILGFARAMRARCTRVIVPGGDGLPLLDTCGTGGDSHGTFNISTTAAFVVCAAGVRVAKHGNRSISSRCGSADILEGLGVNIALTPEQMGACIAEVGMGFLFAPRLHPAMKHAQPVRVDLKMRTVFNLLGPLSNPAGATRQLIGAPDLGAARRMADALAGLGTERALVVHGSDGLDEITTTGPSSAFEVRHASVKESTLRPESFGLPVATLDQLRGGDLEANVRITRAVLEGEKGPHRDIVVANASAALVAAGAARDYREGASKAADAIDSGAAKSKLAELAAYTNQFA